MQTPSIFQETTQENERPQELHTFVPEKEADTQNTEETPLPKGTTETGEVLERRHDGKVYVDGYAIVRMTARGLPTQVACIVEGEGECNVGVSELLFIMTGRRSAPTPWEMTWFSVYTHAKSTLRELITLVFSETSLGEALEYACGSEDFLCSLKEAKEGLQEYPTTFSDAAALFAACLCLEIQLSALIESFSRLDFSPFVACIMGGRAFLDMLSQAEQAQAQLPGFPRGSHSSSPAIISDDTLVRQQPVHLQFSIIRKEDEAPQLRDEIVEQVKLQQPLFLGMITLGLTLLSVAVQPGVSGLIAAFLPLAALALALALNIHSLRTGQLNFILRYVLRSPYEIVRRYLFDGQYPSETEWQILKEQGIEITQEMLNAARELRPLFRDQRSLANWILFLSFELLALGILILRTAPELRHGDLLTILAWLSAIAATLTSIVVLKHTRVRKSL